MKTTDSDEQLDLALQEGWSLPIMEQFYTLQGEGFHTGKAAYFIRIGGCDVGCHWCDVKESWDASRHPLVSVESVIEKASAQPSDTVVLTGGEPLTYNLNHLTQGLHDKNLSVHIETSGAHGFSGSYEWMCLSPKKNAQCGTEFYQKADELKVIIYNRHDFEWAEKHASQINKQCRLYLQPEWSRKDHVMPLIVDYIMKHPRWNISLQSHKYMNIP